MRGIVCMLTGLHCPFIPPRTIDAVGWRGTALSVCTARRAQALDFAAKCAKDAADHSSRGWSLQTLPLRGGAAAEAAALSEPVSEAPHQAAEQEVPAEQRCAGTRATPETGPQQEAPQQAAEQELPAQRASAAAEAVALAGPGLGIDAPAEGGAPSASSALLQASLPGLLPF